MSRSRRGSHRTRRQGRIRWLNGAGISFTPDHWQLDLLQLIHNTLFLLTAQRLSSLKWMSFIDLWNFSLYSPCPTAEHWHYKSLTMQSGTKTNLSVPALVTAPAGVLCNHTEWARGHLRGHRGTHKQMSHAQRDSLWNCSDFLFTGLVSFCRWPNIRFHKRNKSWQRPAPTP